VMMMMMMMMMMTQRIHGAVCSGSPDGVGG